MLDSRHSQQINIGRKRLGTDRWILLALCIIHLTLLSIIISRTSPTIDEVAHLPAGLNIWVNGRFDLYNVNPPLVKAWVSWPVVLSAPKYNWSALQDEPQVRDEWLIGQDFVAENGARAFELYTCARLTGTVFSLLGLLGCFAWANSLYGRTSGIAAASLWCFSPNILAWGATITPDVAAAAIGLWASYVFRCWCLKPTLRNASLSGITLGLAELAKMTWVILYLSWPILWIVSRIRRGQQSEQPSFIQQLGHFGMIIGISLYLINAGYGFSGSGQKLGEFQFFSKTLSGSSISKGATASPGNRWDGTPFASIPVALPAEYVRGIDLQKSEFESPKWSYLAGEYKLGGWWYWYLYAITVKVPLGTLFLIVIAFITTSCSYWKRATNRNTTASARVPAWRDDFFLASPVIGVLVLVSSQTEINRYLRYILPIFPFLFVFIGRVFSTNANCSIWSRRLGYTMLFWSVGSGLWYFPHCLSFFNARAGGPLGGHNHLLDSSIDWGQDVFHLKHWLDEHPEAERLYLSLHVSFEPRLAGIQYLPAPRDPRSPVRRTGALTYQTGPLPGWYAISVSRLFDRRKQFDYLHRFEPVAMAGYSIYIYHITLEDANRVREELNLSPLNDDSERGTDTQHNTGGQ